MPRRLRAAEVDSRLSTLDGWERDGRFISKTFEFGDFMAGIAFIDRVAAIAEEMEHHPDIHVRYTTITLSLQTHSEGGVTEWDFDLAKAIERATSLGAGGGLPPAKRI